MRPSSAELRQSGVFLCFFARLPVEPILMACYTVAT